MRSTRFPWLDAESGLLAPQDAGPLANVEGTEGDDFLGDTSGNDILWGLGGNDTLLSTQGYDVLLGGSGDDEYMTTTASSVLIQDESGDDLAGLALANSDTGYTRLVVRDGAGDQIADLNWQSDRATIEAANAAGERFEFIRWTSGAWTIQHAVEGVEHFQVTGSDSNDLLLARGSKGYAFDGRGGFDSFWADWSAASTDITWVNTPSLTQTVNGIQIAGVERLILRTGAGNDTIDNRGNGSSTDDLVTGAGNDWVAIDQGTVDTGSGNDTITQAWGSVDGGADSDMLHLGGLYNSDTGNTRLIAYDASGALVGDLNYTSSRADIENALASATQFDFTSWWAGGWRTQLHTANIEHWTVNGSNTADLIVARGDGDIYAGNGGFDSFYADWSAASSDIAWVNAPGSLQTVNGLSVSGFERLILRTGAGNDTIDNRGNGYSADDLVTGAGNDWVAIDQGSVDTGSGNDTITQSWGSVDGGADSDMLHLGGVYNSDTGYTRLIAYDASGALVGDLNYTSSRADIENALASATQFDFSSWWSSGWRTQLHAANIEHWTVNGSNTADLIVARGDGDVYAGNGGFDSFYADWSGASSNISWVNTPATTQAVNGLSVSGFERLILRTGAGNDTIDNRGNGSSTDDLVTGAGNDWVAIDQGTVNTGSGNDTITQSWGSVDGGADTDTLTIGSLYNSDTGYTRLLAYDAGGTLLGDLNYSSSRTDIATALAGATQFDFVRWSSGWQTQLHVANVEQWSITGSATNDLIVARGTGGAYQGGGGFDTFYADWSASSSAIILGSTELPNSVQWGGFERSLITGSIWRDQLDLSANSGSDDVMAGAGNDTISGIGAGDTVAGGAGNDVYQVVDGGAVLVEAAGGGIDEVWSTVSFTLGDNFESLRLLGSAALDGTGNARANQLIGNTGDNLLRGLAGNDLLLGDAGQDQLIGGAGADTLRGGADNDRLIGGAGADLLVLEDSAAANGSDKLLNLQAGLGGDVVDLSAFFGPAGATALDGNPGGGTSLDALTLPQVLSGQHLFAVAGDFGSDGPSAKELATLLQGTRVDDGSHQAILVQDLLSGQGHLFFVEERADDGNNRLQAAELHEVAQLTLEGGLPSSALWAENFLLTAHGG